MNIRKEGEFDLISICKRIAYENDERAFSVFFDQYHSRLLRFSRLYLPSVQEAEDVVSEVLIKMLKHDRSAFLKENFIGYLFTCIKNQCFDSIKRNKKAAMNFEGSYDEKDYFIFDEQTPLTRLMQSELTQVVSKAIDSLPPKRRTVFQMIKDDNMSYKEVAALMDISDRTVEVHLKLALKDIREQLEAYLNTKPSGLGQSGNQILTMLMASLSVCV